MRRFSFINAEGEVVHTLTAGASTEYISGDTYGDYLAIEIPNDSSVDFSYYHSSVFWDFESGQWATKPERPGSYYFFQDKQWHLDTEQLAVALRQERDTKLSATDWTQMPDNPLTTEKQAEWASYRQALRDVPQNNAAITHINEVVWPTPPE